MLRRENAIGLLLLLFCGVAAAIMIRAIITGEIPQVSFPPYIAWPIGIAFVGLLLFGIFQNVRSKRSGGDGPAWPDPRSGQKTLGDRMRDLRKDDRDSNDRR